MRSLIIGGNRSGKSARGEQLVAAAAGSAEVLYVAPGAALASDQEFADRIAAHRARRPSTWRTVETRDVAAVLRAHPDSPVIVDDVAAWLTATIDSSLGWTGDRAVAEPEIAEFVEAVAQFRGTLVLVSAEVGLGVLPATATGRQFADILGDLNSRLAAVCDRSEFVVAGRAIPLGGDTPHAAGTHESTARAEGDGRDSPAPRAENSAAAAVSGGAVAAAAVGTGAAGTAGTAAAQTEAGDIADDVVITTDGDGTANDFPGLRDVEHFEDPAVFPRVQAPDRETHGLAHDRQADLTKPAGSLGRLEELSIWYASCRGQVPPPPVDDVRVVVFAGDHGIAEHGVSAYPQEVTVQMVANILAGGAAVSVLAREAGARVEVVDMAVAGETPVSVRGHKVRRSSGSLDREDALTQEQAVAAIAAGRRLADEAIDSGADLLVAGDLGIGNTTPATVLTAVICGLEPAVAVGRGTGVDDNGWMRKATAVRDAMFRSRDLARRPVALLQRAGGADLAAMAGFLAQAAVRQTPCLLDGAVVTAAALVADELAPGARNWWQAGHRSVEPGHTEALRYLGLEPILEAGMRLGEGSGAVAALPVLRAAVAILRDMATFADAGVSAKSATAGSEAAATGSAT